MTDSGLIDQTNVHDAAGHHRYHAPALDKGLDILELLAEQADGMSRGEISTALGRSPSEIYRMVERLVSRGYVHRASGGDRYHLSSRIYRLAMQQPALREMLDIVDPAMTRFVRSASQAAYLGVFHEGRVRVVATYDPPDRLTIAPKVGAELGLVDTATGLVLLAFQGPLARRAMLCAARHPALDDIARADILHERLDAVRRTGYARAPSLNLGGVEDFAFPVLDGAGSAAAVISCPVPGTGRSEDRPDRDAVCTHLLAVSRSISAGIMR